MRLVPAYRKFKRRVLARHVGLVRLSLFFLLISGFYFSASFVSNLVGGTSFGMLVSSAYNFAFTPESSLNTFSGRTNILLLGKAGSDTSDSPELTDTIILASIKNESPQSATLISIPRDIWIADFEDKINAAYKIGNEKAAGGGVKLAESVIEEIVGVPVHYSLVIDFSAITEAINIVDGVTVDVERAFVDEKYPIPGLENADCGEENDYSCRYETLNFLAGEQKMDGETALKYSRSRQSTDLTEGTDFARAARQQKVIAALQKKISSREVMTSPGKIKQLYDLYESKVETDLRLNQLAVLVRRFLQSESGVNSYILPEELLLNPPIDSEYDYLYVFIPNTEDGSWSEVQNWVSSVLD